MIMRKKLFLKRQLNHYTIITYVLFPLIEGSLNEALSTNFDEKDVSKFVPLHATENCNIVANMNLFASWSELTVDCWARIFSWVSYVTKESTYTTRNISSSYGIIKSIYNCKNIGYLHKTITMLCAQGNVQMETRYFRKQTNKLLYPTSLTMNTR